MVGTSSIKKVKKNNIREKSRFVNNINRNKMCEFYFLSG
jgi:hypothetical protein